MSNPHSRPRPWRTCRVVRSKISSASTLLSAGQPGAEADCEADSAPPMISAGTGLKLTSFTLTST